MQQMVDSTLVKGLNHIVYTKKTTGETKPRVVLSPVDVPSIVRAIDVTDLSDKKRTELVEYWTEYQEYLAQARERLFKFEDFIDHTHGVEIKPKWRSFVTSNIVPFEE